VVTVAAGWGWVMVVKASVVAPTAAGWDGRANSKIIFSIGVEDPRVRRECGVGALLSVTAPQQVRQLGDIGCDLPRLAFVPIPGRALPRIEGHRLCPLISLVWIAIPRKA